MTTIDRTCGCEFYFILTRIMLCLKSYINKDKTYDWYKALNEKVATYNNNLNNFNHLSKSLKDKIIAYISQNIKQNVLTEFKKIIGQKSDYGKISAKELKKTEEEFFKLWKS